MGIDWWQGDPFLARGHNRALEDRVKRLERAAGLGDRDSARELSGEEDERSK